MIKQYILALESSCDDTACALISITGQLLTHKRISSAKIQSQYGGVVPEIAARCHASTIFNLITEMLDSFNIIWDNITTIVYTKKPGLKSCLLVAEITAQSLSQLHNKPLMPLDHLDGHIYSIGLIEPLTFPYLCLLISGKTTNLYAIHSPTKKTLLNSCADVALGECFDKIGRTLDFPYPAGMHIDQAALNTKHSPLKLATQPKADSPWSFSGLQTASNKLLLDLKNKNISLLEQREIISKSYQDNITTLIFNKLNHYTKITQIKKWVIVGGVAANQYLKKESTKWNISTSFITPEFAVDNAAMIAYLAFLNHKFSNNNL